MIINGFERNDLEILIGKLNESQKIMNGIAGNSYDGDFVAEIDEINGNLSELIENLRKVKDTANMIGYKEYREKYLNN